MQRKKIGAIMQITETQFTLNTYSCLERGSNTKNITPVHSKANDTTLYRKFKVRH